MVARRSAAYGGADGAGSWAARRRAVCRHSLEEQRQRFRYSVAAVRLRPRANTLGISIGTYAR
jgi:hypothetical protein